MEDESLCDVLLVVDAETQPFRESSMALWKTSISG